MKILVTGGCGFIGSHVVDGYIQKGHQVFVIDDLSTGNIKNLNPKTKFLKANICSPIIEKIFPQEKFEIISHHAAQINVRTSVTDPLFDAQVNILGTLHLLHLAAKYGIKKFIFASSGGAVYGAPKRYPIDESFTLAPRSPYGVSKLAAEKYLATFAQLYDFDYVVLRYSNVYGPRQISKSEAGVISIFINNILKRKPCVVFGHGRQIRDYVYVGDVVEANLLALSGKSEFLNIGTGLGTSVNELINILSRITKEKVGHRHVAARPGEVFKNILDCRKAQEKLRWQPKTLLKKGIFETLSYFQAAL